MRKESDNFDKDEILSQEDMDFFKEFFEAQSSDIVLPESLKAENLSKKYKKEIEEIEKEASCEVKKNNVIPFYKSRKLAAAVACIAFATVLFFGMEHLGDDMLAFENEAPECAEAPLMTASPEEEKEARDSKGENRVFYSAEAEEAEGSSPVEADFGMEKSSDTDTLPPSNNMLLSSNPATGAVNPYDAAKFLLYNGADEYLSEEDLASLAQEESNHLNHMRNKNVLYHGFLERIY